MQRYPKIKKRHPRLRLSKAEEWPGNQRTPVIIEPRPVDGHEDGGEEKRQKTEAQESRLIPSQITATRQIESHVRDANRNQDQSAPEWRVASQRRIHHHYRAENPWQREKRGQQWNDHAPVQQQVAQIRANKRPTIRREKPQPRTEIIAVAAQILNLERFRIWSGVLALMRELSDNTC